MKFVFPRCKIKNIEATEEAKLRLLWEQRNKKEGPSQFVPTNITVNFAQPTKSKYPTTNFFLKKVMKEPNFLSGTLVILFFATVKNIATSLRLKHFSSKDHFACQCYFAFCKLR